MNYISTLTTIPVTDCNFTNALEKYATIKEIEESITVMEKSPKGNKTRITACKRELKKRSKE